MDTAEERIVDAETKEEKLKHKIQTKEKKWTNSRTSAPVRELPASSRDAI